MSIAELSFLFWLALAFQWEFNCKGSLNIAGIGEKLDFVCALDAMVSKTDILDLFWHFSMKYEVKTLIRHNATPFVLLYYAELFHATLHRLCVRCATRHYPVPFDATLHRLCTVLQMSAKLFAIELVHFTISCSNSTWATRPFIIWLNYSCLGCSVSWRKTKPSIIWPCHSFISYSILQLVLKPALYLSIAGHQL